MSRILVTGAAGFLGSHLCDALLKQGHDVIGLDNISSGQAENLDHLKDHKHFAFVAHDVRDPFFAMVDEIYNLACPASPIYYQREPVGTVTTNVIGAINMLELARKQGAKILQTSTSEVYGDPKVHPQTEDYLGNVNCTGPRACYDEGKRCAETLFFDYHREKGIDIKVVRIFNTYGPRMRPDDGRVVSNFIMQALKNEPITIYGEGRQTRSFCYVDDLIKAIIGMMNTPEGTTGPVNIGNPNEFTIAELAEKVIKMTGSKSELVNRPLPADDPKQRQPNIDLAKKLFNWEPTTQLAEGLEKTIAYFKQAHA